MVVNMIIKVAVIFLSIVAFTSARKFPDFVDALTRLQFLNNNWDTLEKVWSASYDHDWLQLQSIVNNNTLQQFSASAISSQCLIDLYIWAKSLKRKDTWAVQSQCN